MPNECRHEDAVYWNQYNRVVQCHRCGQVFVVGNATEQLVSQVDPPSFRDSLKNLINYHSKENGSNTPDFVLAEFLVDCLAAYDKAMEQREKWFSAR